MKKETLTTPPTLESTARKTPPSSLTPPMSQYQEENRLRTPTVHGIINKLLQIASADANNYYNPSLTFDHWSRPEFITHLWLLVIGLSGKIHAKMPPSI